MDSFSAEDAARQAIEWCAQHPGWQRICDIPNSDALYKTWSELPRAVKAQWEKMYPTSPEDAWKEFGSAPCKVPYGFVSGKGVFYKKILDVPQFHNAMMVFKTGTAACGPRQYPTMSVD